MSLFRQPDLACVPHFVAWITPRTAKSGCATKITPQFEFARDVANRLKETYICQAGFKIK